MKQAIMAQFCCKHSWGGILKRRKDKIWLWSVIILTTTFWVSFTPHVTQAKNKYYYIHVGSFKAKKNGVKTAEDLQNKGYSAVVRGEEVPKLGYWYRIYIGPFSTFQEAKSKSDELKKKGFSKYTAIYRKDSLIRGDLPKAPRKEKRAKKVAPYAVGVKPEQVRKPKPAAKKKPISIQARKETIPEAKKAPSPIAPAPPPPPAKPSAKVKEKAPEEPSRFQRRGYGRNVTGGKFSFGWQHTYREVETELTDRKLIESDGVTTTETDVPVSGSEKNDFDTEMHLSMLRIGFGITDSLGIFGDVGVCFDDLDDINLAYGGGARLNLFEVKNGGMRGFYSALQAEYHKGKLETDYQSVEGNRFSKEADWWEFTGKGEVGLARNRFALYLGGTYFIYREDTDRKQLENLPVGLTSVKFEDDLEEENSFGAYGGLSLHLTPGLLINVEGQIRTQNSIAVLIEHRF